MGGAGCGALREARGSEVRKKKKERKKELTQRTQRTGRAQRAQRRVRKRGPRMDRGLLFWRGFLLDGEPNGFTWSKWGAACCAPTRVGTRPKKKGARHGGRLPGIEWSGYSCEPESPPPSPLEEPGLPPPPAAAFCCFSRASRIRALRERRTLLPSMERTLTRTWSPSLSSSRTSRMRCSEISLMCKRPSVPGKSSTKAPNSARRTTLPR